MMMMKKSGSLITKGVMLKWEIFTMITVILAADNGSMFGSQMAPLDKGRASLLIIVDTSES